MIYNRANIWPDGIYLGDRADYETRHELYEFLKAVLNDKRRSAAMLLALTDVMLSNNKTADLFIEFMLKWRSKL